MTPDGYNENGVAMCKCRRYGPIHAWEPGESCNPTRVIPDVPPAAEIDPHAEVCGCPEQRYEIHLGTGCKWFPPITDPEVTAAKERVAARTRLRQEAAERGRLLPADYRENIRQQFSRAEAEARFIVGGGTDD